MSRYEPSLGDFFPTKGERLDLSWSLYRPDLFLVGCLGLTS